MYRRLLTPSLVTAVVPILACNDKSPIPPHPKPKKFAFNRDFSRRDAILGIEVDWNSNRTGGIARFSNLESGMLLKLFEEGFIDPNDKQNAAPTVRAFLEFMKQNPKVLAHGYAVSPKRDDYRVTIEGLTVPASDVTPQLEKRFIEFCKGTDELTLKGGLRSWWD